MKKLKELDAAATRYLNRYSRKQFFSMFVVITAINYWCAYNVEGYKSIWLAMIGGWFFARRLARSSINARTLTGRKRAVGKTAWISPRGSDHCGSTSISRPACSPAPSSVASRTAKVALSDRLAFISTVSRCEAPLANSQRVGSRSARFATIGNSARSAGACSLSTRACH
ncbi:hypothetical protein WR25_26588 [Diploscapter pachys]|uniref:Uncharacterized protein n=1 Tax=Diploscapter pachys TaxID=2018661 RepID=A0A2A2KHI0_9BILA|nr:hypothetical protein WR25_26588 [Diploscapter pachys]